MSMYYYNGVLLPEIPADLLMEYPYAVIALNNSNMSYQILLSKSIWYSDGTRLLNSISDSEPFLYFYIGDDSWTVGTPGNYGFEHTTRPLIWTNHNVPNGSETATAIYFSASEPVPYPDLVFEDYTIKKETLTAIADAIRAKKKITTELTPAQMAVEIEGIETGISQNLPSVEGGLF